MKNQVKSEREHLENTMKFTDSRFLKAVKRCIIMIGIWKGEESRIINKMRAGFFIGVMSFVPINILTNYKQFKNVVIAVETMLLALIMFHSLLTYIVFIVYQDTIRDNIAIIEGRFNNFETNLKRKTNYQIVEEDIVMILYMILSCNLTAAVFVYVLGPFLGAELPFILWLPFFDEGSILLSYLSYVVIVSVSVVQACVQITTTTIYGGCISMANAQIKMLGQAYKDINMEANIYGEDGEYQWMYKRTVLAIKRNVEHYLFVLRFYRRTFKIFSIILLTQFVISEVTVCYCFFQLHEGVRMTSYYRISSGLFLFTSIAIHLFISFYSGERLMSTSNEFHNDIYCSKWYKSSSRIKKMIIIVAECQKQPIIFKAGYVLPITLDSLVIGVKAAFSYFNLLLVLAKEMEKKSHAT